MPISVQTFQQKYNGKSVDFDKQFNAQCVDLFNFYNKEVVDAPWFGTPRTNGARDLWEVPSSTRDKHYLKMAAGSQMQVGDVLVYGPPLGRFSDGKRQVFYGHVAIYIGSGKIIQQNGRKAYKTTIDPVFKNGLLGLLRPRRFHAKPEAQSLKPAPINKNKYIIQKGDSFWAIEEKRGIPHGELQRLNPTADPKKLQPGQIIYLSPGKSTSKKPDAVYYTIRSGDTFWGLETAWQLPYGTLQRLNPSLEPAKLSIGQRIRRA